MKEVIRINLVKLLLHYLPDEYELLLSYASPLTV